MVELRTVIPDEIDRYLDSLVSTGPFNNKAELVRAALASYTTMAGPMAQVFDKDNIFSPDGRVYQVEYARESALRASPSVGVVYDHGVYLHSRFATSPSVMRYPKLHQISKEVVASTTGIVADGIVTAQRLRKLRPRTVDQLIEETTFWFWEGTSQRTRRPLGIFLLIASTLGGKPNLLLFEPSGACTESRTIAVGKGSKRIQTVFSTEASARTAKDAEALAIRAMGKPQKWERDESVHLEVK